MDSCVQSKRPRKAQNSSELKFVLLSTYRENNCPSMILRAATKSLTKKQRQEIKKKKNKDE
jgi:hypothetical protein